MSKRKHKTRIIRIRKRLSGGTVVMIAAATVVSIVAGAAGQQDRTGAAEPVGIIHTQPAEQAENDAPEIKILHIEEIKTAEPSIAPEMATEARTYKDVEFVALPVPMTEQDQKVVFEICQEYAVAFPLVMAIIEHESDFTRTARSSTGDSGYMQINDCNADAMAERGFTDLFSLEHNVGAGVSMLADLFEKYDGDVVFVLMAYNAGEKGAQNMREKGINETEYTREILSRADDFTSYIDNARTE